MTLLIRHATNHLNKAGGTVLQYSISFGITQLIKQHTPLPPSNRDQYSVPEGKSVFGAETDSRVIPCTRREDMKNTSHLDVFGLQRERIIIRKKKKASMMYEVLKQKVG
jgi:hypothetical protein